VKILCEESHALPVVDVDVVFPGGLASEPAGLDGMTGHALGLMRRGAGERARAELDEAIDGLGGALEVAVTADAGSLGLRCLVAELEPMLALLGDVVCRPRLEEDEHERLRRETLAMLDEVRDDDATLCGRNFDRLLLAGHPYGRSPLGTEKTLERFTVDDVRKWREAHVAPARMVVGFAGPVSAERAEALVEKTFGEVRGDGVAAVIPSPPVGAKRRVVIVDKPERSQSQLMLGHVMPPTAHPDSLALAVAATCMGGTFSSRLMSEVRVKRGWSYGVSFRTFRSAAGHSLRIRLAPAAEQTPAALALVLDLWQQAKDDGLTEAEIEHARAYLDGTFAFEVATPADRLHRRLDQAVLRLPPDNDQTFRKRLAAVTVEDVNAAVRRHWRPETALVVMTATAAEMAGRIREGGGVGDGVDVEVVGFEEY
jgi:zinc protease